MLKEVEKIFDFFFAVQAIESDLFGALELPRKYPCVRW